MMATVLRDADIWLHDFKQVQSIQIQRCANLRIEKFLQGSEQLSFDLPMNDPKMSYLHEDQLIKAEGSFWYIDHFEDSKSGTAWRTVVCSARWVELSWRIKLGPFSVLGKTPAEGMTTILSGTDWTVGDVPASIKLYTIEEIDATALSLLRRWAAVTGYELEFNNTLRTVSLVDAVGQTRDIGFRWGHNMLEIKRKYQPPQATQLYPIGANNMTISDVNPTGLPYIEDYSWYIAQGLSLSEAREFYRKDLPWVDQRYLVALNLYDAAVLRLAKLSQPRIFYSAKVIDLTRQMDVDAPAGYEPGDFVPVDDEDFGILEQVRVVRTVTFPKEPIKDEVELGFLTNGLLDVSDGGNRDLDYSDVFMIVDSNADPLTINATQSNWAEIALTSAGAATAIAGGTFVGLASGTGTIEFKMVVDGVDVGRAYSKTFSDGSLVEFSWPTFASDIPEGAHEIHWRAQVISGSGTVALDMEDGRAWILTRGAVGVGINTSPNAFVAEELIDLIADTLLDEFAVEFVQTVPVVVNEAETLPDEVDDTLVGLFILPWQLEDPVFGKIDSVYGLSGPGSPAELGFIPYHPPPGGSSGGSENFGPGPTTAPFVPTDIAGSILWLDASDAATITTSGSELQTWTSKSPGSEVWVKDGTGPTVGATINGLGALTFTAHAVKAPASWATTPNPQSITLFIVAYHDNTSPRGLLDSAPGLENVFRAYDSAWEMWNNNPTVAVTTTASAKQLWTVKAEAVGARSLSVAKSGGTPATGAGSAVAMAWSIPRIGSINGANFFQGKVCEVIAYDSILGVDDTEAVESYLTARWAL